jgi:alanine dehydrogenase
MYVFDEQEVLRHLDYPSAIEGMERAFRASASGQVETFPTIRQELREGRALMGIKSACNYAGHQLGLKAGGYWMNNAPKGLDRHQSTVLLLDLETGRPTALLAANNLTAIRTAAASAVAVKFLAARDARVLTLIGTGRQAIAQVEAILQVRSVHTVRAWSRDPTHVAVFGQKVRRLGLKFDAALSARDAVQGADIVVTVTPSHKPLVSLQDIPDGVHVCAMGSDTAGKQELALDLLQSATVYADDVAQASRLGECQHLVEAGVDVAARVRAIGDLVAGRLQGPDARGVKVFDGTGMAIQDLIAASIVLERAVAAGSARSVQI